MFFTALKRSCGKVMFIQVSVILFTGGCLVLGVPGPRGCLVPGGQGSGPRGVSGRGGAWWRPPRTATTADGTHPTGMHSCPILFFIHHA